MPSNSDNYEEYKKYKDKENSWTYKLSKNIKPVYLFIFIALLVFFNSQVTSGKITRETFFIVLIPLVVVLLFFMIKSHSERKLIPESVLRQFVKEELEKCKGTTLPYDCQINILLPSNMVWKENFITMFSGPTKKEIGFEIRRYGYSKKGIASIDPYTGYFWGFRWAPMGYKGDETLDEKIVPVKEIGE